MNYREDAKQPPKISERLNRYIDSLLRQKRGRAESEIDELMTRAIVIFRYIDDKDLFQKVNFHHKIFCFLIACLSFPTQVLLKNVVQSTDRWPLRIDGT